jgi:ribosomal protein S18 acetylase RimI-like enzyme
MNYNTVSKDLKDCFDDWKRFYILLDEDIESKTKDGLLISEKELFYRWQCRLLDLSNVGNYVLFEQTKDNVIVGMLTYSIVKIIGYETYKPSYYIYICDFYVLPEYRSIGIGKRLLEYIKNKSHEFEIDEIFVGTVAENDRAVRFYTNNGFGLTGYNFEWIRTPELLQGE